jgi:hypothetical protein
MASHPVRVDLSVGSRDLQSVIVSRSLGSSPREPQTDLTLNRDGHSKAARSLRRYMGHASRAACSVSGTAAVCAFLP